jgi:hypothetical protein
LEEIVPAPIYVSSENRRIFKKIFFVFASKTQVDKFFSGKPLSQVSKEHHDRWMHAVRERTIRKSELGLGTRATPGETQG